MGEKVNQEITRTEAGSEERSSVEPQETRIKGLVKPLVFTLLAIVTAGGLFWGGYTFAQFHQSQIVSQPTSIPTIKPSPTPTTSPPPTTSPFPSLFQPALKLVIVGVKIDPPWEAEGNLTPERQREQKAAITRSIDQVLAGLDASKVYARWESIPYFAIAADAETLEYLSNHPLVISTQEDKPEPPTLQESE